MGDSLGDRMKEYERVETGDRFPSNTPVITRIDGRCFSRFTRGMDRPFDARFTMIMSNLTEYLVAQSNALLGYTQSDEITLAWYTDKPESEVFFNGRKFKMTSVLAGMASAKFVQLALPSFAERIRHNCPSFDARVFSVPTVAEMQNAFLWRQLDCMKNAISVAASREFSHQELMGVTGPEKIIMLRNRGISFEDYPEANRLGTFVKRVLRDVELSDDELARIPEGKRPEDRLVKRSFYERFHLPRISDINKVRKATLFGVT